MENEERPAVHWQIEKNAKFIVISNKPIYKPTYEFINRTKIFCEGDNQKIRPPDEFEDSVLSRFEKGEHLFYLMYEDFEVEKTGARYAFLLDNGQSAELLPTKSHPNDDFDDDDLRKGILNAPGFLPNL
ncbi:hypothetical protein DP106_00905 [Halonotius pteroides]|uniref:Uncharacterized protein n=2 Tax=Halonotius pteroides TaxID=268735 RepID=A0A3A6QES1_9EURY|nr:hypothetical protein DP106_00905 [Halonotius pteroides]